MYYGNETGETLGLGLPIVTSTMCMYYGNETGETLGLGLPIVTSTMCMYYGNEKGETLGLGVGFYMYVSLVYGHCVTCTCRLAYAC